MVKRFPFFKGMGVGRRWRKRGEKRREGEERVEKEDQEDFLKMQSQIYFKIFLHFPVQFVLFYCSIYLSEGLKTY